MDKDKIDSNIMAIFAAPAETSCNAMNSPETLTMEKMNEVFDLVKNLKDPVALWMKDQGYDPEDGGLLILPVSLKEELGERLPPYAMYSILADTPCLIRKPSFLDRYSNGIF